MPRLKRDAALETPTARSKLKARHAPYWRQIYSGLAIGYRKGTRGGVWLVRYLIDGEHRKRRLGVADDNADANGTDVLSYTQAHHKALEYHETEKSQDRAEHRGPYTINHAMDDYLEYLKAHGKSHVDAKHAIDGHIKPKLGKKQVSELTTAQLRRWHQNLATAPARTRGPTKTREVDPADAEAMRKRKATANRVLTYLKAALNHAWHEGHVSNSDPWRKVKAFHNVDAPRVRYLTEAECTRLLNACDADLRHLVRGALLTGCRYGELIKMKVHDYNPDSATVLVAGAKSGYSRHVPLTGEGQAFFDRLTAGRKGGESMFTKGGEPWGKGWQIRPLKAACKKAEIDPPVGFHVLRHTYGSLLAMKGVPLKVIAEVMGHTSTRMTERHYAHLSPSYVADTIRAHLPEFGHDKDNVTRIDKAS